MIDAGLKVRAGWAVLVLMMFAGALAGGCQRTLFSDADKSTEWRIKRYYNGDSAAAGTANMKQTTDMGFGIPGGGMGGDH